MYSFYASRWLANTTAPENAKFSALLGQKKKWKREIKTNFGFNVFFFFFFSFSVARSLLFSLQLCKYNSNLMWSYSPYIYKWDLIRPKGSPFVMYLWIISGVVVVADCTENRSCINVAFTVQQEFQHWSNVLLVFSF